MPNNNVFQCVTNSFLSTFNYVKRFSGSPGEITRKIGEKGNPRNLTCPYNVVEREKNSQNRPYAINKRLNILTGRLRFLVT